MCQNKFLLVLIAGEDEDSEADLDAKDNGDLPPPANTQLNLLEVSMFALGGITGPRTMKLRGRITELKVVVMVDSGASHCFINQIAIDKLGLHVTSTGKFGVRLGDGSSSISRGVCRDVKVWLRSTWVQVDCYVFPLGTVDLILGIFWLATLGEVRSNWAELGMKFKKEGEWVILQGDPTIVRSSVSARSLQKMKDVEFCALLYSTELISPTVKTKTNLSEEQ